MIFVCCLCSAHFAPNRSQPGWYPPVPGHLSAGPRSTHFFIIRRRRRPQERTFCGRAQRRRNTFDLLRVPFLWAIVRGSREVRAAGHLPPWRGGDQVAGWLLAACHTWRRRRLPSRNSSRINFDA